MNKKNLFILITILVLLALIPAGLYLIKKTQIFKGRAFDTASSPSSLNNTSYEMKVLVLKYFPLVSCSKDSPWQCIDIKVTGDIGGPYAVIRQRTIDITNALKNSIEKASTYLGYQDDTALPALRYTVVDTKEYQQAVPIQAGSANKPDLNKVMSDQNICNYVDNQGVREVWLWAYQGSGTPKLLISESQLIAGTRIHSLVSDFSNGPYYMVPRCQNSYRIYTFNYNNDFTFSALESWGHQMEFEISSADTVGLFRSKFQGPKYPQTLNVTGRCGSVHNPPNARYEYDRDNPIPQRSDCLDWNPDNLGQLTNISCQNWGCQTFDVTTSEPSLNYQIWMWQNLPGRGNTKTYQGKRLRNFWDIHGDFDNVMTTDKTLFLSTASPTPRVSPSPISTPSLPAPVIKTASCNQTTLSLSWNQVTGVSKYQMRGRKTDNPNYMPDIHWTDGLSIDNKEILTNNDGSGVSCYGGVCAYTFSGLSPQFQYRIWVNSVSDSGGKSANAYVPNLVSCKPLVLGNGFSQPANVSASCDNGHISVYWDQANGKNCYDYQNHVRGLQTDDPDYFPPNNWTDGIDPNRYVTNGDGGGVVGDSISPNRCSYTDDAPKSGTYRLWIDAYVGGNRSDNVYIPGLINCGQQLTGSSSNMQMAKQWSITALGQGSFNINNTNQSAAIHLAGTEGQSGEFAQPFTINLNGQQTVLNIKFIYQPVTATPTPQASVPQPSMPAKQTIFTNPDGFSAQCLGSGQVKLTLPGQSPSYLLRVDNLKDGWDGSCASAAGDFCATVNSPSYSFNINPKDSYQSWYHSVVNNQPQTASATLKFSCGS